MTKPHRSCIAAILACGSAASAQPLFYADIFFPTLAEGSINRADPFLGTTTPVTTTGGGLRSIALDPGASKVYWCDVDAFAIRRANFDGSSQEDLVTTGLEFPSAVALLLPAGKLYWGDQSAGEIRRANLDGSSPEPVITTPFNRGLALDAANGTMYWSTSITATTGAIFRANLDGTGSVSLVSGPFKPDAIALDVPRNRIYFTDSVTDKVRSTTLAGTDLQTIYSDQFGQSPRGIAVDPATGDLYWGQDFNDEPLQGRILVAYGGIPSFTTVVDNLGAVNSIAFLTATVSCYPNCDDSTIAPILNVADFSCFLNRFASGDPYANCDGSTTPPVLNVSDFACFLNAFAAGCS